MNRFPAFAALAFALSTLCACDPSAVVNHNAKGPSAFAPDNGQGCNPDQGMRCSPPANEKGIDMPGQD